MKKALPPNAAPFRLADEQLRLIGEHVTDFNRAPAALQRRRINLVFTGAFATLASLFILLGHWLPALTLLAFLGIYASTHWLFQGITGRSPLYDAAADFFGHLERRHWMVVLAALGLLILLLMLTRWFAAVLSLALVSVALVVAMHFLFDRHADTQRREPLKAIRLLLDVLRRNGVDEQEQQRLICDHGGDDWEPCFELLFGYEALLEARRSWSDDEPGRQRPHRRRARDWAILQLAAAGPRLEARQSAPTTEKTAPPSTRLDSEGEAGAEKPTTSVPPSVPLPPRVTAATNPGASEAHVERLQRRLALSLAKATRRHRLAPLTWRRTRGTVGAVLVALCALWIIQNGLIDGEDLANVRKTVTGEAIDGSEPRKYEVTPLRIPGLFPTITDPILEPISGFRTGLAGGVLIAGCVLPVPGIALGSYFAAAVMMFADRWGMPDITPFGAEGWSVVAGIALLAAGILLATLQRAAVAVMPSTATPWRDMALLNTRGQIVHGRDHGRGTEGEVAIRYLKAVLAAARHARASDVHFEPESMIRMRVDGSMIEAARIEQDLFGRLLNLVKILCDLDIAKPGTVQDGSFQATWRDRAIDFRASFAPVAGLQKLVVRVLNPETAPRSLEDLHMPPSIDQQMRDLCARDNGMLLVCGPTGSGKTTTLYAALRTVDVAKRNVITIEDPVEYHLGGITQTAVHEEAGNSFSHLLRAALRQDPDVMLVGEIRDSDTATTALRAAMTGHLVLSTMHANDAVGALVRLVDLGTDANLLGSSLRIILVQRLIRTLCPHCKVRRRADPPRATPTGIPLPYVFAPRNCRHCLGTGYRGRRALFEMLTIDDAMTEAIHRSATMVELQRAAKAAGLVTMAQTAWAMVAEGVTSLDEVERVLEG